MVVTLENKIGNNKLNMNSNSGIGSNTNYTICDVITTEKLLQPAGTRATDNQAIFA